MVRLSAVQLCSVPDVDENFKAIDAIMAQLPSADEHLVLLPECCLFFGGTDKAQLALSKRFDELNILGRLANLAIKYNCYLVAGTVPVRFSDSKFSNSSIVFTPTGKQLGHYNKLHLFDVTVADKSKTYAESNYAEAGRSVQLVDCLFANVGLSVCYDLRFPSLFRSLRSQGADIITVPSAFTRVTGKAHWLPLLQARAIENQVYIVAAGQEGVHDNGRETWGHSMIISPWGEVLSEVATSNGFASAIYEPDLINEIRSSMPVLEHDKFKVELENI